MKQIWRLPPKTSKEDGDIATRPLRMYLLRENECKAPFCGHLDVQELQENCGGGCVDCFVSTPADDWN